MPNKTGDLGQAGQPRLNNKLSPSLPPSILAIPAPTSVAT
jgi:hypothetical protein